MWKIMFRKTIILPIFGAFLFVNYVDSVAFSYNVKLKGMEQYDGIKNPIWNLDDLKLKKVNKTHFALDGLYSVLRDDVPKGNLIMSMYADHKKGNGYESLPILQMHKVDYCESWDHDQLIFPSIKKSINETNYPCPPNKGHYALVNFIPDTNKIPPSLPEGLWRISFEFFDQEELVGGYKIFADLKKDPDLE